MNILRQLLKHPNLLNLTGYEKPFGKKGHDLTPQTRQEIFKLVKQAHCFVIDNRLLKAATNTIKVIDSAYPLALPFTLPFEVCWFQADIGAVGLRIDGSELQGLRGALVKEISPGVFDIFTLAYEDHKGETATGVSVWRNVPADFMPNSLDDGLREISCLKVLLSALNTGDLGVEFTNETVDIPRIKIDKMFEPKPKTKPHTINKIIRIVPNRKEKLEPVTKRGIVDWSHRWEVRGHWRKIDGIGKDREGEYLVSGFTWVKNHEKGSGELIKKTRVVSPSKQSEQISV